MFRKLIRPEFLFLAGTLQALLPYAVWTIYGPNETYSFSTSTEAPFIWCCGLICFLAGCLMIRMPTVTASDCLRYVDPRTVRLALIVLLVALIPQFAILYRTYNGIPLLQFLSGTASSAADIDKMLNDSTLGQMAVFIQSLNLVNALLLVLILMAQGGARKSGLLPYIILGGLTLAFGTLMGGKRQGLVFAIWFLAVGLSIAHGDPVAAVLKLIGVRSATVRTALYVVIPLSIFSFFQLVGAFRNANAGASSQSEAFRYLEIPLINLEYQCELAGFGPSEFDLLGLCRTLLPRRFMLILGERFTIADISPRLEPTCSGGFYGDLHWYTGMYGVIGFSIFAGALCKYCYLMAYRNLFFLLIYAQISWTLFSAHTYNHFFYLPSIPLTSLVFAFATLALQGNSKQLQKSGMFARAPQLTVHRT